MPINGQMQQSMPTLFLSHGPPDNWATRFENWLRDTVEGNGFERLITPEAFPDEHRVAHPSIEHYAPLVVAWAAGGRHRPGRRFADGFMYGNLGMSCYAIGVADRLTYGNEA